MPRRRSSGWWQTNDAKMTLISHKIDVTYPKLLKLIQDYVLPKRTESASFLMWYLEKYCRLDPEEAVDSVCDAKGDKGVDGIYVNNGDATIDVFQSKISQSSTTSIGDTVLKEFAGTLSQFKDATSLENLVATAGSAQVGQLVSRLGLKVLLETHQVRGIFLSNVELDANGKAFLASCPQIRFIGKSALKTGYISDQRSTLASKPCAFDISGFPFSEYIVDSKTKALIVPIKANELAKLDGIDDQSIFDFNVRGPLGKTQVNRDIVTSIRDATKHKLFPLFHNGITFICGKVANTKDKVQIEKYYVVNGCQSLTALHENRADISDNLRILTKFVQLDVQSELPEMVTRYSNNQNGVKPRDWKSNDPIQVRLQTEFKKHYGKTFFFEIKRGETATASDVISNEDAGLYLMAFDLKEPWGTHRKYQVFDDKHAGLFARPEVNADRIVACHVCMQVIAANRNALKNKLFGKHVLTKFLLLYILRHIFEVDPIGKKFVKDPSVFVRKDTKRKHFQKCVEALVKDIVIDVNAEVEALGDDFDYRGKLRDESWVKDLKKAVVTSYEKGVARNRITSFEEQWGS
jgi:hypothetical protein